MILRPLTMENLETIRHWRNEVLETLRTPFMLTREQQEDYYHTVICDRHGTTRYWGFWIDSMRTETDEPEIKELIGYGGIENIQWENRLGEISLLIGSEYRNHGAGATAVEKILHLAFKQLNLFGVYGECYTCSPAVRFWKRQVERWGGESCSLPGHRKYWEGYYWPSMYFYFPSVMWVDKQAELDTMVVLPTADGQGMKYGNA